MPHYNLFSNRMRGSRRQEIYKSSVSNRIPAMTSQLIIMSSSVTVYTFKVKLYGRWPRRQAVPAYCNSYFYISFDLIRIVDIPRHCPVEPELSENHHVINQLYITEISGCNANPDFSRQSESEISNKAMISSQINQSDASLSFLLLTKTGLIQAAVLNCLQGV